jgi:hypothetical protein
MTANPVRRFALALTLLLATSACAFPGAYQPNFGLPVSEPTLWPYCVTELADHWISYPAQKDQNLDRVCGPKDSSVAGGLELLGAYSFDKISRAKGGRVRVVLSAQTRRPDVVSARLAEVLRHPAMTATYAPWQESRELEVAPRSDSIDVRGRRWEHIVVAQSDEPENVWVEDYITPLDDSVVLVLRARYALDDPLVPEKMTRRRALVREILTGIDVVALD